MKEFMMSQDVSGAWVVRCDKLPGYQAKGKTQVEAIEKMKDAMRVYFPCGECKGDD